MSPPSYTLYGMAPLYKPLIQVDDFLAGDIGTDRATLNWVVPSGHKRLRAFRIMISSTDTAGAGGIKREFAVRYNAEKEVNSFLVDNIKSATLYSATIKTVCVFENLR